MTLTFISLGNIYPNAETLMNAVLNYEQNREELNGLSPHHQGSPHILQTDERRNARRRSRSSTSSKMNLIKTKNGQILSKDAVVVLKDRVISSNERNPGFVYFIIVL